MEVQEMDDMTSRALEVLEILDQSYPDAPPTYLEYSTPFEMLIATILSANTMDKCVNSITPELFKRYPDPKALSRADKDDVIDIIRPCGTYNRKSDYIIETSRMILDRFEGEIPRTMEDMVKLKGVSRKTANVVLAVAFDIVEGVVVDTHIRRVTQRLGLTEEKSPKKIEQDLMEILPKKKWYEWARLIGAHGRRICEARSPKCPDCPVNQLCPSAQI